MEQDELLRTQEHLICLLKEEIRQLHLHGAEPSVLETELMKSAAEIRVLKAELFKMR